MTRLLTLLAILMALTAMPAVAKISAEQCRETDRILDQRDAQYRSAMKARPNDYSLRREYESFRETFVAWAYLSRHDC